MKVAILSLVALLMAGAHASALGTDRLTAAPTTCSEAAAQLHRATESGLRMSMVTANTPRTRNVMWDAYHDYQANLITRGQLAEDFIHHYCRK